MTNKNVNECYGFKVGDEVIRNPVGADNEVWIIKSFLHTRFGWKIQTEKNSKGTDLCGSIENFCLCPPSMKNKEIPEMPKPKPWIKWDDVIIYANTIMEDIKNGRQDEDREHWMYEAVMEAIYGKDVWTWINKQK